MKNINIRPDTLNLIEGKVGKALELRKELSKLSTMIVQILRSTINNCGLVKLKNFVHQKTPSFEFRDSLKNGKKKPQPSIKKLETDLPQYLTLLFLGTSYYRGTLPFMFISALFIIAIHC